MNKTKGGEAVGTRFLREPAVEEKTGLSESSIYAKIAKDQFPKPIKLGARAVAWLESDVEAWMDERIAHSRNGEKVEK